MKLLETTLILLSVFSLAAAFQSGQKGDEEGEFYGGKWPSDVPKKTPVVYRLPFPAGKSFGRMPGGASHTAVQNRHAIDFMMPMGAPVCASADGMVIKIIESGPDRGGRQNSLILQHADGMCTCYLHLKHKGVIPKLGDFVFQADVVAYSGASGTGTPHLHFSVNKFEMLECVKAEFFEGKSGKPWVSQNYSFEQKYAKRIADYREIELRLVWGPRFGLWKGTVAARKSIEEVKPADDDDIRLKRICEKVEKAAADFDEALEEYIRLAKETLGGGNQAKALECASFGTEDFKGTEHEEMFAARLAAIKEMENYEELQKQFKKSMDRRKKLAMAFGDDLKGSNPKKVAKAYLSFEKKYRDSPQAQAAKERTESLLASKKTKGK